MQNIIVFGFSLYNIFYFFTIYSIMGWCLEVVYSAVNTGKFINRGFLNAPVCPIYGFGVVIVLLVLSPLKDNLMILFLGSLVLTSTLEFSTGFVLEKIFHNKWWDYSYMPFNISGYICLKFSLAWGFICVVVVQIIHPIASKIIDVIPVFIGQMLAIIILFLILTDFIATIKNILHLNKYLKELDTISKLLREKSDKLGKNISKETLELKDRYNTLILKSQKNRVRLIRAFPNVTSKRYSEILKDIKEKLKL